MTDTNKLITQLAVKPSLSHVARYKFKMFDEVNQVYCVLCSKVINGTSYDLQVHFESTCDNNIYSVGFHDYSKTFKCRLCDFITCNLKHWRFHLSTNSHKNLCVRANSTSLLKQKMLYTLDLTESQSKSIIYDFLPIDSNKPDRNKRLTSVSEFMAYVFKARMQIIKAEDDFPIIFCGDCQKWGGNRIENYITFCNGRRTFSSLKYYYCETCRVVFISDQTLKNNYYEWHLYSAEHGFLLGETISKKQLDISPGEEYEELPKFAMVNFQNKEHLRDLYGCIWCNETVGKKNILKHFDSCRSMRPLTRMQLPRLPCGKTSADYEEFQCVICLWTSTLGGSSSDNDTPRSSLDLWMEHVSSKSHPKTCGKMRCYTYTECHMCHVLRYGEGTPSKCDVCRFDFQPFRLSDLMCYVYGEMNDTEIFHTPYEDRGPTFYYKTEINSTVTHFGRCDRSLDPDNVPFYCPTCRLEFYGTRTAFRQHAVTAEHLLLEEFAPVKKRF